MQQLASATIGMSIPLTGPVRGLGFDLRARVFSFDPLFDDIADICDQGEPEEGEDE